MSRPIPIKSPREGLSGTTSAASRTSRISQSLPVPQSPHFGSLKAPPEFLSGMPPLALPASFQENERIRKTTQKEVMAKSAPATDLTPLHQYRVEDKRRSSKDDSATGGLSSSLGTSVRSTTKVGSLASSLHMGMNALRLDGNIIDEGVEEPSPETERGVLLSAIQQKVGIMPVGEDAEDMDDLDLAGPSSADDDDEELQFELS